MSPDVRKYGIYVLYDVKWIWYYSNFSPKFYVLKFDLRYPQNFWTYNISIHQNNKCNAGSRSHPGLGHTTSHLCGQHNSWKCKQMYMCIWIWIWIWIFMIKCTLKSIYQTNIEFFYGMKNGGQGRGTLLSLWKKKSKVSDIQTIGKGVHIKSVYTSFLILVLSKLIQRHVWFKKDLCTEFKKSVSPEKNLMYLCM